MQTLPLSADQATGPDQARACSFCRKPLAEVHTLVAGPGEVGICDACVALCTELAGTGLAGTGLVGTGPPAPEPFDRVLAAGLVGQLPAVRTLQRLVGEQLGDLALELAEAGGESSGVLVFDGVEGLGQAGLRTSPRQVDGEDVQMELLALLDDAALSLPRDPARPVEVRRLLRLLVATLDPLPPDEAGIRAALLDAEALGARAAADPQGAWVIRQALGRLALDAGPAPAGG